MIELPSPESTDLKSFLFICASMQVCKALSNDTRKEILETLLDRGEPLCMCEINPVFEQDGSVIYRHVMKLEEAGLVETEKDGRRLLCTVSEPGAVEDLLDSLEVLN